MSKDGKTKTILSDVLYLYSTRLEDPLTLIYELECTTVSNVSFTLDFEGSENFQIIRTDSLGRDTPLGESKLVAKVSPFSRQVIGRVVMIDDEKRASLRMGCSWLMEEPDEAELKKYMLKADALVRKEVTDAEQLDFPRAVDDPDHTRTIALCKASGKLFVDKDFLPCDKSLYGLTVPTDRPKAIEWRRPAQFFKGPYALFRDGIAPEDIRQGALGDCWFLCAIAALTEFPVMIENLFPVPGRTGTTYGVHTVRFCKNGLWVDVRVDDFFPCYPMAGPLYSKANGDELWVLLLEKAYAKLHGSYDAIRAGWAYEAMMDLTGAPCVTIRFDGSGDEVEVWGSILRWDIQGYLMSASTPGEDTSSEGVRIKSATGLVAGHAYTLIAAKQSSQGHRLVKLRNPWGSMEWTGDWSDSSPLWTQEMQAEIEVLTQVDDGTFWMCFEDLLKHFSSLNVCMTRLPGLSKQPWHEARRAFFFDYVAMDEEDSNHRDKYRIVSPSYLLTLSSKSTVIATLHQEDIRCEGAKAYIDIGLTILKADPVHGTFTLINGTGCATERQHQTDELTLEAGKYILVPSTSGCKLKQHIDRWKAQAPTEPVALTQEHHGEIAFTDAVIKAYTELFHRMDCDFDGLLSKAEMDQYMLRTEGATIEDAAFTWMLHNFESKDAQGISLPGFLRAQLYVFQQCGGDEEKLWKEFRLLGYDDQLNLQACRSVALSVHGTAPFVLDSLPYDQHAVEEAEDLVIMRGEVKAFENGLVKLYKLRAGSSGVSVMVENLNHMALVFQMDCTKSENVISHRPSLLHKEVIGPNERRVLHHLMPADPDIKSWSWSYSASYFWDTA